MGVPDVHFQQQDEAESADESIHSLARRYSGTHHKTGQEALITGAESSRLQTTASIAAEQAEAYAPR